MAGSEFFASLTDAVSAEEPCGPDLDLAGDPDFLNSIAKAEGILPTSFFTRDDDGELVPFDRMSLNFAAETKVLDRLLDSTRDFRLLTLYLRFMALNRDLAGFGDCASAIAALTSTRWEDVHPRGDGGDFGFRGAILQAMDDMPTVILPLQHVPLATGRRSGNLTFRAIMVAKGDARGREGDPVLDESAIERILLDEDLDKLQAVREQWSRIGGAADTIRLTSIEKAGFDQAVTLERLPDLVAKVLAVLDPILVRRDPNAAAEALETGEETESGSGGAVVPTAAGPAATIGDAAAAKRALAAASEYFRRFEPSSPAALITRQAQDLIGKSFYDVLQTLLPRNVEEAKIRVGSDGILQLTSQHLSTSNDAMASDWSSAASEAENSAVEPEEGAAAIVEAVFDAKTRQKASSLLEQVGSFFRKTEPSSPIPMLLDRARSMMDRDFATLLRDVLPDPANGS